MQNGNGTTVVAQGRPVARQIDNVKNELEELIDRASQNSSRIKEIAMRLGYREAPEDTKEPMPSVPQGHLEELSAKSAVLDLIINRTRNFLEFVGEKV